MPHFILLQYPYDHIEIGLSQGNQIIDYISITKFQAVTELIPSIDKLLHKHNLSLKNIDGIGVNAGPGPFNTLRSIIATANGIAFATKIPLISCNALTMLLNREKENTVALLHAFGKDVYFASSFQENQAYASIDSVIQQLNEKLPNKTVHFIGNGAIKYHNFIEQNFIGSAVFDERKNFSTLEALASETFSQYQSNSYSETVTPLYLQSPAIKSQSK